MNRIIRFRRPKQPPVIPAAGQPPAEEPPATLAVPVAALAPDPEPPASAVGTFRVGEYEVGEGYCPHLWGHPGIRY